MLLILSLEHDLLSTTLRGSNKAKGINEKEEKFCQLMVGMK